ncbi:MAG: LLM class flavin-dependent oxidoreductase [Candidatus Heimdallarchaeota archaeon]|nr:LLM class flavin-dependent oxidoreductase [Candidatus Heimdallarchaeota archaeon]
MSELGSKLGFILSYDYLPPSLCHDLLALLDNSSFTHVFVPELWGYDAFTQLATMATHSKNLNFATGIVNLFSRTPATLAQTAASLSHLTEGRFILGLGLSGPIVIRDWHGMDYYKFSPLQRTREYLEVLRLIFSGERVNYSGKVFSLRNFKLFNVESPINIPLFLAALGPKNIKLAGELADGWMPVWAPFSELPTLKSKLEEGMRLRDSRLPLSLDIAPYLITCASTSEKAKKLVSKHIAYYVGGMGTFYYEFVKRLGYAHEANKIKIAWNNNQRELAAQCVSEPMLNDIAVLGTQEYIKERYQEIYKAGVSLPIVMLPYRCPSELAMETIGAFC